MSCSAVRIALDLQLNEPHTQRGASTLETKELYTDSQQQAVNMKILESRKRNKEGASSNMGGQPQEREESPIHSSQYEPSGGR